MRHLLSAQTSTPLHPRSEVPDCPVTTPLFITYDHLTRAYELEHIFEVGPYTIGLGGYTLWHPRFEGTADATGVLAEIATINPYTAARVERRLRALVKEDPPPDPGTRGVGRTFRA